MNKLKANMTCISSAEGIYTRAQSKAAQKESLEQEKAKKSDAHIDLAA